MKKNGLDLKITPYKVIATSQTDGLIECVTPCDPISKILENGEKATHP